MNVEISRSGSHGKATAATVKDFPERQPILFEADRIVLDDGVAGRLGGSFPRRGRTFYPSRWTRDRAMLVVHPAAGRRVPKCRKESTDRAEAEPSAEESFDRIFSDVVTVLTVSRNYNANNVSRQLPAFPMNSFPNDPDLPRTRSSTGL